jgi:hypothetical protein
MNSEICKGCIVEMCCTKVCEELRKRIRSTIGSPICPFCDGENYFMRYLVMFNSEGTTKYNVLRCPNCANEIYDDK